MEQPQSPPKRVTRARAAAKATEASARTSRAVPAAALTKARTTTTASKRKAQSEDVDADDEQDELGGPGPSAASATTTKVTRAARGRPRKTTEPAKAIGSEAAVAIAARPRGRPKKAVAQDPADTVPTKTSRTLQAANTESEMMEDGSMGSQQPAARKATRGRPALATTKPAVKKTVKFEEPEKENIVPATARTAKATSSSAAESGNMGLRAKPVRRPAAAARTTRAAARTTASTSNGAKPTPLSPKKITQVAVNRDISSDDELAATGQTPIKPLMKSPVKAPISRPLHLSKDPREDEATSAMLGTPARHLPPTPFKDVSPLKESTIKSPPKRVQGLSIYTKDSATAVGLPPASAGPSSSLFGSPARRPPSPVKSSSTTGGQDVTFAPLKTSLLGSPAKRLLAPVKEVSTAEPEQQSLDPRRSPGANLILSTSPSKTMSGQVVLAQESVDGSQIPASPPKLKFSGRLSSVLPRHADPALNKESAELLDQSSQEAAQVELEPQSAVDEMVLDEPETIDAVTSFEVTERPYSPPMEPTGVFTLRANDLDPYHNLESESEDELASGGPFRAGHAGPTTPCPRSYHRAIAADYSRSPSKLLHSKARGVDEKLGFTPLAKQLGNWAGGSNVENGGGFIDATNNQTGVMYGVPPEPTPTLQPEIEPTMRNGFFEEAMSAHDGAAVLSEVNELGNQSPETAAAEDDVVFNDVAITDEDMALAAEAHEMSLLEPGQVEEHVHGNSQDDAVSEASQEYGDENAIPIDPAILNSDPSCQTLAVPPVTPQRTIVRTFHTVSKVPLKPADESTPRPKVMRRRSASVSRLPVHRLKRPSNGLSRNATVISYSPTKHGDAISMAEPMEQAQEQDGQATGSQPPATPAKSETGWSTSATPARTPRRDVNSSLLRGAVVFVDVHTSEGADASGIFVELLTQMGARCVKTWAWNPSSPPGTTTTPSSLRIGITHVVYKDGGKRTLEKVRESAGVVQCVGVSWVLDCERENTWLEEAPYYIDTSFVPRGGARRRKSMEPQALANLNGTLVPTTPARNGTARDNRAMTTTPVNRRQSGLWTLTPSDDGDHQRTESGDAGDDTLWNLNMLTPVPKTPAPDAVARFAANVSPATPSANSDYGGGVDGMAAYPDELLTRTCPAKPSAAANAAYGLGEGIIAREKDQGVMMRLMAARRKSMQFAPKVGSPLSKTWD